MFIKHISKSNGAHISPGKGDENFYLNSLNISNMNNCQLANDKLKINNM